MTPEEGLDKLYAFRLSVLLNEGLKKEQTEDLLRSLRGLEKRLLNRQWKEKQKAVQ